MPAGFYIAWHPWLALGGGDSLFKVGFSADLSRRLLDGCYSTCFPLGWRYRFTLETEDPELARDIETAVLHACESRRVDGRELVALPLETLKNISLWSAGLLNASVLRRDDPEYPCPTRVQEERDSASNSPPLACALTRYPGHDIKESNSDPPLARARQAAVLKEILELAEFNTEALTDETPEELDARWESLATAASPVTDPPCEPGVGSPQNPAVKGDGELQEEVACLDTADSLTAAIERMMGNPLDLAEVSGDLRPYQREAAECCLAELRTCGKAVLQMACRCGKTRVAHALMEMLSGCADSADASTIFLFLVPGLPLLRQTAQKLLGYNNYFSAERTLLVGSDPSTVGVGGASLVMTTDPGRIVSFLFSGGQNRGGPVTDKKEGAHSPRLLISTYQSSVLIPQGATFHLIVLDEAHRSCGNADPRPFSWALFNLRGPRLSMTATPIMDPLPVTMKDKSLYGGVAFRYYLRQGIDAGFVNDFGLKLVATGGFATPEASMAKAIVTASAEVQKLLVFCRNISHAEKLRKEVDRQLSKAGCVATRCFVAHSRQPRQEIANSLRDFGTGDGCKTVMFNCRLFQEGVEIPQLDGVFFASPRHSFRDIIQSLCRPLNRVEGKATSTVFLPLSLDGDLSPDDPSNLKSYASIVPVFDALASEDQRLYEHLLNPLEVDYPIDALGIVGEEPKYRFLAAVRKAVRHGCTGSDRERLLRPERLPWEIGFGHMKHIVYKLDRYPKTTETFMVGKSLMNFYTFYRYCREGYRLFLEGKESYLEPHQLRDLESLPHWKTYGLDGCYRWQESLAFLENWLALNQGVPPACEINVGGFCGLSATPMERLAGFLTTINQACFGKVSKSGEVRKGMRVPQEKVAELDRVCNPYGLRWRKEYDENGKTRDKDCPTFIQESHSRFKEMWKLVQECEKRSESNKGYTFPAAYRAAKDYIDTWFPGYPKKHQQQERLDLDESLKPIKYKKAKSSLYCEAVVKNERDIEKIRTGSDASSLSPEKRKRIAIRRQVIKSVSGCGK